MIYSVENVSANISSSSRADQFRFGLDMMNLARGIEKETYMNIFGAMISGEENEQS